MHLSLDIYQSCNSISRYNQITSVQCRHPCKQWSLCKQLKHPYTSTPYIAHSLDMLVCLSVIDPLYLGNLGKFNSIYEARLSSFKAHLFNKPTQR